MTFRWDADWWGAAAQLKQPILVSDVSKDQRYIKSNPENTVRIMCTPYL